MLDAAQLKEGIDQALAVVGAMDRDTALLVLGCAQRIVEERPVANAKVATPVRRRRTRTVATKPAVFSAEEAPL